MVSNLGSFLSINFEMKAKIYVLLATLDKTKPFTVSTASLSELSMANR